MAIDLEPVMMRWLTLWGERASKPRATAPQKKRGTRQQAMYDQLVVEMKETYQIRVRKWRGSTSGCAWEVRGHDGSVTRLIESPYPRGPVSCVIFLHEVGHHAIGLGCVRLRCLEEHLAWAWALEQMRRRGLRITDRVRARHDDAMRYAVAKALRRGLRRVPPELASWLPSNQPAKVSG